MVKMMPPMTSQAGLGERLVDEHLGRLVGIGPLEPPADEAVLLDAQLAVQRLDLGVGLGMVGGFFDEVGRLLGVVVEAGEAALEGRQLDAAHGDERVRGGGGAGRR